VIGVLDVQSTEEAAFGEDDVAILQTMADQVAVALENARLLEETEDRLRESRTLLQRQSEEGWIRLSTERPAWGYTYDGVDTVLAGAAGEETKSPGLKVPVQVRDQTIGHLNVALGDRTTTQEDMLLAQAVADQVGQALESARLYQDTQRRAAQEQLLGEVTGRMRESLEMEAVLRTAAEEMRRALGLDRVVVRLATPNTDEHSPEA
jgi:GAF domain-containing protein